MSTNTTTSSHHHRKSSHNLHRRHDSNSVLGVSTIGHRQQNRKLDDNANANASSSSHDDYAQKLTTKVLELLKEDSPFFDSNPPSIFPTFSSGELQVAPKELGRGEFGIVWRILALHTEDCPCPKCHGSGGGPAKLSSSSKTAITDNTTTGTAALTSPNAHEPLIATQQATKPIDYSTKPTPQQPASTLGTTAPINSASLVRDHEAEKPPLLEIGPAPPATAATTSGHSKTPPTTIITTPTAAAVAAAVAVDLTPSSSSPPPRSPRTAPASVDTPQQQQRASRGVVLHRRHTSRISFSEDVITKRTDSDDSSLSTEADDDESLIEGAAAFEKMRRRNNNKNNNNKQQQSQQHPQKEQQQEEEEQQQQQSE